MEKFLPFSSSHIASVNFVRTVRRKCSSCRPSITCRGTKGLGYAAESCEGSLFLLQNMQDLAGDIS